jgi:group I intron endonuclease
VLNRNIVICLIIGCDKRVSDKVYIVYQHINKTNNKCYIGITGTEPEKRWGRHGERYKECPLFWNAIQKYGWDNFEHKILMTGLTAEEACEEEKRLIAELHANDPKFGYNISSGGTFADPNTMEQNWNDPAYREFMTNRFRETWKDPEKRKRRSEATKKRWANPEFKEFAMARVRECCKKAIRCVETGEVFDMMATAAAKYSIHRGDLTNACKKGYRAGGYHWEYA